MCSGSVPLNCCELIWLHSASRKTRDNMPFAVTHPQLGAPKLYLRDLHVDQVWTPVKADAIRMTEPEADRLAEEINRYASVPCVVEGIQ